MPHSLNAYSYSSHVKLHYVCTVFQCIYNYIHIHAVYLYSDHMHMYKYTNAHTSRNKSMNILQVCKATFWIVLLSYAYTNSINTMCVYSLLNR